MCGRFTLTVDPGDLVDAFPSIIIPPQYVPRYNIAPTQPVAVIANTEQKELQYFIWGLIPSWAKDPEIGNRMINARAETLPDKPAFRAALRRRRCLILADGFYEWQAIPNQKIKQPVYFRLRKHQPFGFAGLWEIWQSPDGSEIRSCTIVTTEPNKLIAPIHNRMPVILDPDDALTWLSTKELPASDLLAVLKPYPDDLMESHLVSRAVNNPANDLPECIQSIS